MLTSVNVDFLPVSSPREWRVVDREVKADRVSGEEDVVC
jgi:hypothetical protein